MNDKKTSWLYWILPALGVGFCLYYVLLATNDVVYDDYIRLVNSYLPDVWNPKKFFVPDVLTRIPINYAARIINVSWFGFSTTFDTVLGVLGLGLSAVLLSFYCLRQGIGWVTFLLLMSVIFSLNKWEMLTNGSGWCHFAAFAAFYFHYLILDRVAAGREKAGDRTALMWMPFVITLGLAGPYCAVYSAVLLISYGFCLWIHRLQERAEISAASIRGGKWYIKAFGWYWDGRYIIYGICAAIPLLLYMWSNSYAVYEHAGATDQSFMDTLSGTPSFFMRFFVKSFASMVMGSEVMTSRFSSTMPVFFLGLAVMAAYGASLWLNFNRRLYRRTVFPLICLAAGGMNHLLILCSRWIFLNEDYGMSSRYALQYQIGILGVFLTFSMVYGNQNSQDKESAVSSKGYIIGRTGKTAAILFGVLILAGNWYTCREELKKAPYRREYYETRIQAALQFESLEDDELKKIFDYRKTEPGSGAKVRQALTTLKEHGWNVYR